LRRGVAKRHRYGETAEIIGEIAGSKIPEISEALVGFESQNSSRDALLGAYFGLYST
jgi:hypothetical protein